MKKAYSLGERILAMMLVCIMVMGMVPVNVFAANGYNPALSISTGAGEIIAGNPVELTVNLAERRGLADQTVTGNIEIKPNPADSAAKPAKVEYSVHPYTQWVDVSQFKTEHVAMDSYKFRVTFETAGRYDVTVSLQPKTGSAEDVVATTANLDVLESVKVFASPVKNGTIQLNGKENTPLFLKKGENTVSVQVTPKTGFEIKSVTVGSKAQSIENKQSFEANFSNLTKDTEVTAEFKAMQYTIQVADGLQNGTVTPNKEIIKYGEPEDVRVDVVPAYGYEVDKITLNDSLDPVKVLTDEKGQFFTIPMVSEDYVIHASFKLKKYDVTVTSDGNGAGEWKLDPLSPVEHGTDAVLTITPDRNSFLHKVMIDGEETAFSEQNAESGSHQVTIRNVQKAKDVVITFKQKPQWKPAPEFTEQVKTAFKDRVYNPQANTIDLAVVSDGTITYSLANQNPANVASLEGNKLTILRAGSVTVVATRQGDTTHKDTSAELELVVGLGAQEVQFSQDPSQKLIYGAQNSYTIPVVPAEENLGTAYVFSVPAHNDLGVSIDPATGVLTGFNDQNRVGTVKVTVARPADDRYAEVESQFTVKVDYEAAASEACKIVNAENAEAQRTEDGWYGEEIYIHAPAGYQISSTGKLAAENWSDRIEVADGNQAVSYYLKKNDGGITDVCSMNIQKDTVAPQLNVDFQDAKELHPLTNAIHKIFGAGKTVTVKFTVSDALSGLKEIRYKLNTGDSWIPFTGKLDETGSFTVEVQPQFRDNIRIEVKDKAGRTSTNGPDQQTLVVDDKAPGITPAFGECNWDEERKAWYPKNVKDPFVIQFTIEDDNFDLRSATPEVKINNEPVYIEWNDGEKSTTGAITLPNEEGIYNVRLDCDDGINKGVYEKSFYITKTGPQLDITHTDKPVKVEGNNEYYRNSHSVTLDIAEKDYLKAKNVKLTLNGQPYHVDGLNSNARWGGVFSGHRTFELIFNKDGQYTLDFEYTSRGNYEAIKKTVVFTVDSSKPSKPTISYDESANPIKKVIEAITFHFYKAPVTVNLSANDTVSGVDHFLLTFTKDSGAGADYQADVKDVKIPAVKQASDNKFYTASYELPLKARGKFSVVAVDKCGVKSEIAADNSNIIVTDQDPAGLNVTYNHDAGTKVNFLNADKKTVAGYEEADSVYYNGNVTAKIEITEDNFFEGKLSEGKPVHEVLIRATRVDDLGKTHVTEYLCAGADPKEPQENLATEAITWSSAGGVNTANVVLQEPGDYVLEVSYQDFSRNGAVNYTSKTLTVDKAAPVFETQDKVVDQHGTKVLQKTFTVTEHNFKPDEVNITVTAVNHKGETIAIDDYTAYAKDPAHWSADPQDANRHVLVLTFAVDAVYTFSADYTDLALNPAAHLGPESFTVDNVVPTLTDITVNSTPWENIQWYAGKDGNQYLVTDADVTVSAQIADITSDCALYQKLDSAEQWTLAAGNQFTVGSGINRFSLQAKDTSENITEWNMDAGHFLLVDKTAPVLTAQNQDTDFVPDENSPDRFYTSIDGFKLVFTLKEEADHFAAYQGAPVVTIQKNSEAPKTVDGLTWENLKEVISIPATGEKEDASFAVTATYTDGLGRKTTCKKIVEIRKNIPQLTGEHTEKVQNTDSTGVAYYKEETHAITFSVTDKAFRERRARITLKDANRKRGDRYENAVRDVDYTQTAWKKVSNTDTYTCTVTFIKDGHYLVDAFYKNQANKEQSNHWRADFVVDHVAPSVPVVTYGKTLYHKILEDLSFGFFKAPVTVTISTEDSLSPIKSITYSYQGTDGEYTGKVEGANDQVVTGDGSLKFTTSFELPASYKGKITAFATDFANNDTNTQNNVTDENGRHPVGGIVVDPIAPQMNIAYEAGENVTMHMVEVDKAGQKPTRQDKTAADDNTRFVYSGPITARITVTEANFFENDITVVLTKDGVVQQTPQWVQTPGKAEFVKAIPLADDGDYIIEVSYQDKSGNDMIYTPDDHSQTHSGVKKYISRMITVDATDPVIKLEKVPAGYSTKAQTAEITVTDRDFRPGEMVVAVPVHDIYGKNIPFDTEYLTKWNAWTQDSSNPNKWSAVLNFSEDARYESITADYTDIAGHKAVQQKAGETGVSLFVKDTTKPEMQMTYNKSLLNTVLEKISFGFYNANVTVSIVVEDDISEVADIHFTAEKQGSAGATDQVLPVDVVVAEDGTVTAANLGFLAGEKKITRTNSIDTGTSTVIFEIPAQFRGRFTAWADNRAGLNNQSEASRSEVLVVDTINPQMNVTYAGSLQDKVVADGETISRNTVTEANANTRFVYSGDITATLEIKEANFFKNENDVVVSAMKDGKPYTQFASSQWEEVSGKSDTYRKTITLHEDGDYQLTVSYKDKSTNNMTWTSDEYNKTGTEIYTSNILTVDTVKPKMEYHYESGAATDNIFYKDNRTLVVSITDRNFRPQEVMFTLDSKDVSGTEIPYDHSSLTAWSDWKQDGDTWTARVPLTNDADYTLNLNYKDIAGNPVEKVFSDAFTLDREAPVNAELTYSESLLTKLTFGYYKDSVQVTLKATDAISGVHSFKLNVAAEGPAGATNVKLPENLVIGANGKVLNGDKGSIRAITSNAQIGAKDVTITFEIPAQFRGKLSFDTSDMAHNTTEKIVNDTVVVVDNIAPTRTVTMEPTRILNMEMENVDSFQEKTPAVLYFNKDAVLKFQVNEANFYKEDITVNVNGKAAAITPWKNTQNDLWESSLILSNDGDYVVTMEYTDRSTNKMVSYVSQRIVVDKTAPVVNVNYVNTNVKNTFTGRDYYDAVQTAVVTIKEHNFRAGDVVVAVSAKDVTGKNVLKLNSDGTVASYAQQGAAQQSWSAFEKGTWRRQDDTYVLTLIFDADANYTLDVSYEDLAANKASDYQEYAFTVDKTAPVNLSVAYSTGVLNQILQSVTFGYYNAPIQVTITAEDITTGVEHFLYSAKNAAGVSGVNAELIDAAIRAADIHYDGAKATARFTIPKAALTSATQFNGSLQFSAFDRSENSTLLSDSKRLVVDNITPTAQISYNSPVKEVNDVSYYSGNINGTIVINEANFHSGDVKVTVTKDGTAYPVNVAWHDNSTDVHTGSFTLTEEGDYTVAVQYRDKSGNAMADYLSNQMTIDTTIPSIKVSNIKNNSANKDDVYSFVITVDDVNLDTSTLKPVLSAVVMGEDGRFTTKEIALGNPITISQGKTYRYSVANLTLDAMYSLSCSVMDMSGNTISHMLMDDGQELENVKFSVNRDGSAFGFGNEFTEKLVNQYFVYSVDQNVEILEVNVDPIEHYSITLNGKELKEGTDYITEQTSKDGQWSKRTYSINKNLFVSEGEYNIIVSSTDKTHSTAYSDVKNLKVGFVVDQTDPVITISGLENNGRYQTELQTVTLIPSDEGGRLYSLKVVLLSSNGKPRKDDTGKDISIRFNMEGEEFQKYLEEHDGVVSFTIPEGLENSVQIICNDCAVNAEGETNEYNETFKKVTVSQSGMIMFYANKPLLYSTIGILVLVIFLIIFLVTKKKKDQKNKK